MMKRPPCRAALTAGLCALISAPPSHAFDVDLQPTTIEVPVEAGDSIQQVFTVTNRDDDAPVALTIGAADWTLGKDGNLRLLAPGSGEASAASWISYAPVYVELAPGETRRILVDIAVPEDATAAASHRAALLASTMLPDERDGAGGLLRRHEVASLLYLTGASASSEAVIRGVESSGLPGGAVMLELRVENTGTAHARLEGELEVRTGPDQVSLPVSNLVVLAGSTRTFSIPLEQPLGDGAAVTARFRNIFAPQAPGNATPLTVYSSPLSLTDGAGPRR